MPIAWTARETPVADAYNNAINEKKGNPNYDLEPTYAAYLKMLNMKFSVNGGLHQGFYFLNKYLHFNPENLLDDFSEFNRNINDYIIFLTNDDFIAANIAHQYIIEKLESDLFYQQNVTRNINVNVLMFTTGKNTDHEAAPNVKNSPPIDLSGAPVFAVAPDQPDGSF